MKIGFVGAGRMGWPMVLRLKAAGHEVCVLARNVEAEERARAAGVSSANFLAGVAADAELVISCVFTDPQTRDVCLQAGGLVDSLSPGATIITHTTGSPKTVLDIAEVATARGISVLDAPVSGGPDQIAAGTITLFVGGDDAVFERAAGVLGAYGSPVLHVGPLGNGQRVKLINNAMFAANIGLVADAVRLGESLGVQPDVLLGALSEGSGGSRAGLLIKGIGSIDRFAASVGEFVSKDVAVVQTVAADLGADLGVIGGVLSSPYVADHVLGGKTGSA